MSALTRREALRAGAAGAAGLWLPFAATARAAEDRRVPRRALRELERRLQGRLLVPGDRGYGAASRPANARFDRIRPVAVARCAGERDVVACVEWARAHGVDPVARGGGHSYAGFSATRGLIVDVSRLNRVTVDRRAGTAVLEGGALNRDLLAATTGGAHVLPGGTCLGVGVAGLTLGGGIGYNTHWAGLTCDHLTSSRMVTAGGRVLHVDAAHHPDLFWALRGGAGGSFGINTRMAFRLVEVPRRDVAFYRFDWRGADAAAAVLRAFDRVLAKAPAALNAVAMAQAAPVGRGGPREAIDVFSRGQYVGPMHELRELVRPLLHAAGKPVRATFETHPYWDMQAHFSSSEAEHHAFGDVSRYSTRPLPDRVVGRVVDLLADCPERTPSTNGSMWSLGWVGGPVVDGIGRRETAYVHRNAHTLLRATPVWDAGSPRSVRADLLAWTDDMIGLIAPHTPAESYQNFPNRRIPHALRQYYGENLERLVRVKRRYDPHDVFRNPQSIPVS